jgi:hypothetical protein
LKYFLRVGHESSHHTGISDEEAKRSPGFSKQPREKWAAGLPLA